MRRSKKWDGAQLRGKISLCEKVRDNKWNRSEIEGENGRIREKEAIETVRKGKEVERENETETEMRKKVKKWGTSVRF